MLYLNLGDAKTTREYPLAIAAQGLPLEEGTAMVKYLEGGIGKVAASAGASNNDRFAGIAMNQQRIPTVARKVYTGVVDPNLYTITLPNTPIGGIECVVTGTTAGFTSVNPPVTNTEFYLTGNSVLFYSGNANVSIDITYGYSPTMFDVIKYGGGYLSSFGGVTVAINSTTIIEEGTVYTNFYQTSDNWAAWTAASTVKAIAGGILTMAAGATGATVSNLTVESVPTANYPLLGVRYTAIGL